MEQEVWKGIMGFESTHQVSNMGRVKSLSRCSISYVNRYSKETIMKPIVAKRGGYLMLLLRVNNKPTNKYIHRLVAEAFIPNTESKREVNHKNGDKKDNRVENLEWATPAENIQHAFDIGLKRGKKGSAHHLAKLTDRKVKRIREMSDAGERIVDIAKYYKVTIQTIYRIIHKTSWSHI